MTSPAYEPGQVITEQAMEHGDLKKYVFIVARDANKIEIRKAVETQFGVHVLAVRTVNMKGGLRTLRGTRRQVTESTWKRAIVEVKPGERIEMV